MAKVWVWVMVVSVVGWLVASEASAAHQGGTLSPPQGKPAPDASSGDEVEEEAKEEEAKKKAPLPQEVDAADIGKPATTEADPSFLYYPPREQSRARQLF